MDCSAHVLLVSLTDAVVFGPTGSGACAGTAWEARASLSVPCRRSGEVLVPHAHADNNSCVVNVGVASVVLVM